MATKKNNKPAKKAVAKKPVKKAAAKKVAAKAPAKKTTAKAKPVKKQAPAKKPAPKKTVAKAAVKPAKKEKKIVKKTNVKPAAKKAAVKKKPIAKSAPKKVVAKAAAKAGTKKVAAKKKAPPKTTAPAKVVKKTAPAKGKHEEVKKPVAKAPAAKPKKQTAKPVAVKAATKAASPKAKNRREQAVEEPKTDKPLVTVGAGPSLPRVTPMVAVQVSTLEAGDKERYSDAELEEFRTIINAKLDEARRDYDLLKQTLANTDNNGTEDTSPSFKMIEDGSETLGREETAQLAGRQEKFIKHLEDALLRIRNKTYGICRVTGKLISKERLRLVPHATLSIEAKQQMNN